VENSYFCCLCRALCLPNKNALSTSQKNRLKWKEFNYSSRDQFFSPIFAVLIDLYDGNDVYEDLESCRINPDYTSPKEVRNDLEFYIPQLTNFMVFHQDVIQDKLQIFLEEWSQADPYFAHLYYWYINSLASEIDQERGQAIINRIIQQGSEHKLSFFCAAYDSFFSALSQKLTPVQYEAKLEIIQSRKAQALQAIEAYKNSSQVQKDFIMRASDIELQPYASPFLQEEEKQEPDLVSSFMSTILFFEDLCFCANDIIKKKNRPEALKQLLHDMNRVLRPSYVYIPIVKESLRYYSVLNIVAEETKVFSTKERAPFYVCLELFMPQEELAYEYNEYFGIMDVPPIQKKEEKIKFKKTNLPAVSRAKTMQHISKDTSLDPHPIEERRLENQFKIGSVNEIVSIPMTLKNNRRSPFNSSPSHSIPKSNQSVIDANAVEFDNAPLIQFEECKQITDSNKPSLISPHDMNLKNNHSEDVNTLTIAYNHYQTNDSSSDISHHNKSLKSSFMNRRMSFRKAPFADHDDTHRPDAATPLQGQNLDEEEKVTEHSKESDELNESKKTQKLNLIVGEQESNLYYFGEDSEAQAQRIKRQSPFGTLRTWRLVHLIIKSGADMKEEQFAIQLISKFDHIFKLENLKLKLSPYEILALGDNAGLVEVVKDAVTLSKLKEKMYLQNISTLNQFFEKHYGKNVEVARKEFCKSLAAYSLVCYFLQIKDRHNGNIMLHKDGHVIHIDFGFFLSNSPGKGIELERKIPFKLLNEYVEVLGGHRSYLFQKFRSYFYKGFLAARKHKEQILILVKMIYSSHSQSFPCFKTGMRAIVDLEQRFDPPNVQEKDLRAFCYELINHSLDNWRAKFYDKYQYYFQGIIY